MADKLKEIVMEADEVNVILRLLEIALITQNLKGLFSGNEKQSMRKAYKKISGNDI